jgi:hypothetical protein
MKRYKNIFNLVALTIVLLFFAWMFSTATPNKPKNVVEYQAPTVKLKTPMTSLLFPPKSPFKEVANDK